MPRLTLDISDEIYKSVSNFAYNRGISEDEAMKRAFALLAITDKAKGQGHYIGIVHGNDEELQAIARIEGLEE
uniref:Uncharacterized protein n=1 Tax=Candidatus Kentrum sp. LPFa TaxID=2126335 RepID=A0A450XH41_9GAMM|nr:MAG: hypothetical protein BECKLPF1236A_GA0070988_100704 [Candidatus Kentron sp. LPFa]VFK28586.1 MAG: hypothetical protein BECKLPF1236C_GA0070990_100694 [Candidatus Kentron sp. LPFa]